MNWKKAVLPCIVLYVTSSGFAERFPYQDSSLPVKERVIDLLSRMTLEEKIAELNLIPYYAQSDSSVRSEIRHGRVGALLKANGVKLNRSLQEEAMKHSRLGIPLIFHEDVIHGYRTLAPIPLAESCSWDTVMVARSAAVSALEAASAGIQLTYAPMVDISNDPRWGRIMETSGEDPFLGAAMAAARVRGFQGKDLSDKRTLAACVKHFAGYGALLAGRDYLNTDFSQRDMIERYLPPFRAAIEAGVASVMCSYTSYEAEPVTMNRYMNTDVLRKMLGFKGLYMTDWTTLNHAVTEGAAENGREASRRALCSGIEMDMSSRQFSRWLKSLVETGEVDSMLIEQAAAHALELKFKVGLFEDPYAYFDEKREKQTIGSLELRQTMFDMACESMVLLKNDNSVLPLDNNAKIALVGPFASMKNDLMGSWTMMGQGEEVISVVEGFKEKIPAEKLIDAGCAWNGVTEEYINQINERIADASVVVACLGEFAYYIGEGVTTGRLELPNEQLDLLKRLKASGKKIVVVLFNGRPLVLNSVLESCDALLEAWYPGTMGGMAVASLLLGEKNPSGKLTQTFPRHVGQVPVAYNFRRTFGLVEHADLTKGVQFPFGYGLSYTTFSYSKPITDKSVYTVSDSVTIKVQVKNSGTVTGREIVQLYIRDEVSSVVPREKELRGFASIVLQPGEEREIVFKLPPEAFTVYNTRMEKVLEPGIFQIMTGEHSESLQKTDIRFIVADNSI